MYTFSWSIDCAGYDPGQYQSIDISLASRVRGEVVVNYAFFAESLGADSFYSSERCNYVRIWVGGKMDDFTYQIRGGGGGTRYITGTIRISDVLNGVTSLPIAYENDRLWLNAPDRAYSPRSTGVFDYEVIGYLQIPDNVKRSIKFNKGYNGGKVTGLPSTISIYDGSYYTIPNNIIKDSKNHYVFKKGYTYKDSDPVNLKNPVVKIGANVQALSDGTWYATWKKQSYAYRFFTSSSLKKEYSFPDNIKTTYTYSNKAIKLPNLNSLCENGKSVNSEYYKKGFDFVQWLYTKTNGSKKVKNVPAPNPCDLDFKAKFYPQWKPITSKINFDFCYGSKVEKFSYTYGTAFQFAKACNNPTLKRPGYKLIGWSYSRPPRVYNPFEASKNKYYTFKVDDTSAVDYINDKFSNYRFKNEGITLYAVWEYYTTSYVYTGSKWQLALPYIYDGSKWKVSLGYIFTDPKWKL